MSASVHQLVPARPPEVFRLDAARVDLNVNVIEVAGREHRITPKAAAVMALLAVQPGRAVSRDELLQTVWADAFPTDDVLSHAITELRRALGDEARNSRYIETIPKVGYRLLIAPEPVVEPAPAGQATVGRTRRLRRGLEFLAGLVVGALAVAFLPDRAEVEQVPTRDPLADSFPVSAQPGPESMPAISADGRQVAFVAAPAAGEPTDIVVKSLLGEGAINVTQSRGAFEYSPTWSPDGDRIAFLRFDGDGCRIIVRPVSGGLERDLVPCIADAITYVDWSPDGGQLAMTVGDMTRGVSRIYLVDVQAGDARALDYPLSDEHDVQPKFSPDGAHLLFRRGVNPRSELYVVPAAGGAVRRLTDFGSRVYGFDWLPDSERVWFCAEREGAPRLYEASLASRAVRLLSGRCAFGLSIAAATEALAFEEHSGEANLIELALPLPGGFELGRPLFVSTRHERDPAYAPDGQRLVFVSDRSGEEQLWLGERASGEAFQLTRLAGLSLDAPRFGADGETVVFVGRGGGAESLYRVSVRSGIVERVSGPSERVRAGAQGPDGAVYLASDRSGSWQLWRQDPRGGPPVRLTSRGGHRPIVPGDGFVYYTRLDVYGLWRVPVAGGEEELVSDRIQFANHEAWFLADGWIYAPIWGPMEADGKAESEFATLVRFRIDGDGAEEVLHQLPASSGAMLSGVAPGGQALLFTRVSAGQEDILAVAGF